MLEKPANTADRLGKLGPEPEADGLDPESVPSIHQLWYRIAPATLFLCVGPERTKGPTCCVQGLLPDWCIGRTTAAVDASFATTRVAGLHSGKCFPIAVYALPDCQTQSQLRLSWPCILQVKLAQGSAAENRAARNPVHRSCKQCTADADSCRC